MKPMNTPKHAITSLEYLLRMKGFSAGAHGWAMDRVHFDDPDYNRGYSDGQRTRRDYSKAVCEELKLVNPEMTLTVNGCTEHRPAQQRQEHPQNKAI